MHSSDTRRGALPRWVGAGLLVLGLSACGFAAGTVDYSGTYQSRTSQRDKTADVETIYVVQDASSIEIDRALEGKTRTEHYALDGAKAAVTNADGFGGTGHVQFKDGVMVVETMFAGRMSADDPVVKIHTVERWRLSEDGKSLTIEAKTDFPGMSRKLSGVIDGNSHTTYVRVEAK